ncbi:MAG TPA: DUF222 domain-containing protein [Amycolatopsis sp.]
MIVNAGSEARQRTDEWRCSDEQLAARLVAGEERLRRDYAEILGLVGELERRGSARTLGYTDTAVMLRETLRVSSREAGARIAHAQATMPSAAQTGAFQPAPLAATGHAVAAGAINREHLQLLVALFRGCPAEIGAEQRAADEATLLGLAAQATPEALRAAGRRLAAYWDQDTTPPDDRRRRERHPRRRFDLTHRPDGSAKFTGELDPDTTAVLDGLLGPLAKPHPDTETQGPDPRTAAERRGDALADIIGLAARCDDLTVQGGERAVLIVTVTLAELEGRLTDALVTVAGVRSLDALRRDACEAKVVPAVFGSDGQPLYLGRTVRLATPAQRRALVLRDKGCAHPGCDRGPKWCTAHHLIPWQHGGTTDLDNLVLLCPRHHRQIHHSGWTVRMRDGLPEFRPPGWLDSRRTPRRNHVHDTATRHRRRAWQGRARHRDVSCGRTTADPPGRGSVSGVGDE